jgi:chemotaxis protein CheD
MKAVFLKPADIYVGKAPAEVVTILGSCVSVTMFNERFRFGAICHALLPSSRILDDADKFRYVDSSMHHMLNVFERMGINGGELKIKLLGGANMIERLDGNSMAVGKKNVETALRIIAERNLRLVGSDVGGTMGRKIYFSTHTGEVLLKRIEQAIQGSQL